MKTANKHQCPQCLGEIAFGDPMNPNTKRKDIMVDCEICKQTGEISDDQLYDLITAEITELKKRREKINKWHTDAAEELSKAKYTFEDLDDKLMSIDTEIAEKKRELDKIGEEE